MISKRCVAAISGISQLPNSLLRTIHSSCAGVVVSGLDFGVFLKGWNSMTVLSDSSQPNRKTTGASPGFVSVLSCDRP